LGDGEELPPGMTLDQIILECRDRLVAIEAEQVRQAAELAFLREQRGTPENPLTDFSSIETPPA
jgi:hypothetical protein